jgi:hypothetical protein
VHEYTTDKGWNSTKNKGKSSYFFTIYAGSGSVDFSGVSNDCRGRIMSQLRTSYFSWIYERKKRHFSIALKAVSDELEFPRLKPWAKKPSA